MKKVADYRRHAEECRTHLEQRGGVAIAFMAAALWIMLLIPAWEYLF
jgi:hypothetical protein